MHWLSQSLFFGDFCLPRTGGVPYTPVDRSGGPWCAPGWYGFGRSCYPNSMRSKNAIQMKPEDFTSNIIRGDPAIDERPPANRAVAIRFDTKPASMYQMTEYASTGSRNFCSSRAGGVKFKIALATSIQAVVEKLNEDHDSNRMARTSFD